MPESTVMARDRELADVLLAGVGLHLDEDAVAHLGAEALGRGLGEDQPSLADMPFMPPETKTRRSGRKVSLEKSTP